MTTDTPGTDSSDPAAVSSAVPFTATREPSAKERAVLDAVKEGLRRDGRAPTVRALADRIGASSTSTIQRRISALIELGLLRRTDGTLEVVEDIVDVSDPHGPHAFQIEVFNAGESVDDEHHGAAIAVPSQLLSHGDHVVVIVHDDGMMPDFHVGDLVVVQQLSVADLPDDPPETYVVAATVGATTIIRSLAKLGGKPWLMASNPAHSPVNLDDASLVGRVVSIMRRL
ncbi:LexA family transcriptional regulator [Cutibacterium equinum]|uniref:LexA family transcriptional regulator n=1 Tax=Cutibacterium equinum TaxID=3016342 RepID=A0ABY7R0E0_9ACTN|nr:S24 family peptidase [Cutibacterium equinum]WCC80756.1 LexA family transcriptional regulator [Cutibacterium equinum]